jgi:hypothetical protein
MNRFACATVLFALVGASCAGASPKPTKPPTGEQWADAHAALTELRRVWAPRSATTRIAVRFAFGDAEFEGRGAVAIRLPDALRMQIVGPGGWTAMDLWVGGERWRLALPQRDRIVRGDEASGRSERGLPVGFLRWWLLRPLEGRLLSASKGSKGWMWILKDGEAVVDVREDGADALSIERRSEAGHERVRASTPGCGRVHYEHREAGVRVDVLCEEVSSGTANSAAFEDPDARAAEPISGP